MADKLDILLNVQVDRRSLENVRRQLQDVTNTATNIAPRVNSGIRETTQSVETLGNTFTTSFSKFTQWLAVSTVFFQIANSIKFGITTIKELDSALVELRRVTEATSGEIDAFTDSAFQMAKEIGSTADEVIRATSAFARMGFELSEASVLAESAIVLKNVGDGVDSIDESTAALIATLKGFNFESSKATEIIDSLNEVSNNFALNTGDLAEGIRRTSGVLSQTNTTFDETLGLLTGGTEVLQNIEKVSSGLITVSQRLRGVGEEGENLTPKLEEAFSELFGTTIRDANGELKSTFDLLTIMAERTDELNSVQKQYIFELAAGKRQVPVLQAIVSNWESVTSATETSANAIGSAQREQEIFLDSIQGRYQTTIAQIQEFWSTLINSDAIKTLVTSFGDFVEVLTDVNKTFGSMPVIIIAVSQALIALKGTQIAEFFSGLITTLVQSAQSMAGMTVVTDALTVSVGALQASLGIIAIAFIAVAKATQDYNRSLEEARKQQEKFAQANKDLNKIINEGTEAQLKNRIEALEGLSTQYALLSMRLGQLKLAQNEINASTDEGINKLTQNRMAQKELQQQIDLLDKSMGNLGTSGANVFNRLDELRGKLGELEQEESELVDTQYDFVSSSEKKLKILTELELKYRDMAHSLSINKELLSRLDKDDEARIPILEKLIDQYKQQQDNVHALANAQRDLIASNKLNLEQQQQAQAEIQKLGREWQSLESSIISASKEIEQIPLDIAEKKVKEYEKALKSLNDELKDLTSEFDESIDSQITRLEEARDASDEYYDSRIQAIQDEIDALKDSNDEREKAIRLAEKEQALQDLLKKKSNIESERNIRTITSSGTVEYVADARELATVNSQIADAEKSLAEEIQSQKHDQAVQALEDEKSQLEERKKSEQKSFNDRINNLKRFQKDYQSQIEKDGKIQESLLKDIYGALRLENEKYFSDTISGYENMVKEINESLQSISDIETNIQETSEPSRVTVSNGEQTYTIDGDVYRREKDNLKQKGFTAVGSFRSGGLAGYTGEAMLHGTASRPEMILNFDQQRAMGQILSQFSSAANLPNISPVYQGTGSQDTIIEIGSISLPNVSDGNSFVSEIQDLKRSFATTSGFRRR